MSYQDLLDLDARVDLQRVPVSKVEFKLREVENGDRLHAKIGDHEVRVQKNPRQFETICQAFGVPFKFAENVSQTLLGDIFREMADRHSSDDVNNWLIDSTEEELVSFGDSKKPYIPYGAVGSILEDVGLELDGQLIRHGAAEITGTHPSRMTVEPRVGDVTRSGVNIHMNPTNDDPPIIAPWSLRLVCTNGMTSLREKPRISVVGYDVDDVLAEIEYEAQKAMEFAERLNHSFADMSAHQVDPVSTMENMIRSGNIPSRMRQNLLELAGQLPGDQHTMYDVLNIYTRLASGTFDPDTRFRLQAVGGDLALDNHLHCARCGTELA